MSFEKNIKLEDKLRQLNDLLEPLELHETLNIGRQSLPNILLIGSPRSGSTFFIQWAASLGLFSYPSNFLSRFYKAPYIGALIYEIVTNPELQYKSEFSDIVVDMNFTSSIGKTSGFISPHDFWYFWRNIYDFPDIPCSEDEFEKGFNHKLLNDELALIQKAFGKPFLCKGRMLTWYLETASKKINDVIYLHLYRDPIATIRSLFNAREKWTGNDETWFSWKPREYFELIQLDKYHQVAGQFYYIEKEILTKRKNLGNYYLSISYEELCNNPENVYNLICAKIKEINPRFDAPSYMGDKKFQISNRISEVDNKIRDAYFYFVSKYGELDY